MILSLHLPPHRTRPRTGPDGFTLLELLVVITTIALLIGMLLPVLGAARQAAQRSACAANLRGIGQALHMYAGEWGGVFPTAYTFNCNNYFPGPGLTHFSGLLCGEGYLAEKAFHCPAFTRGGLPPTDTTPDNLEPGQSNNESSYPDRQVARCAYTVNEALCPQPYFLADPPPHTPMGMMHYVGTANVDLHANRLYRNVRFATVQAPSSTILATEWPRDWRMVAGPAYCNAALEVSLSYRPVHGFASVAGNALDPFDVSLLSPAPATAPALRQLSVADLATSPAPPGWRQPRLNWIGRNHEISGSGAAGRVTNFAYVDGHVESKTVEQTLVPFEWGRSFYSLRSGDDIAAQ